MIEWKYDEPYTQWTGTYAGHVFVIYWCHNEMWHPRVNLPPFHGSDCLGDYFETADKAKEVCEQYARGIEFPHQNRR